jgi:hypothetical protein
MIQTAGHLLPGPSSTYGRYVNVLELRGLASVEEL